MKNGGWLDNYGEEANANEGTSSASKDWMGEGYSNVGRNYSPAWGGQFAMGGSIPGSVGFTYARTNSPAPSEGPYAKKTMPSAQNGKRTKRSDSAFEDFVEVIDPSGISSWDDVYRSYQKSGMQGDTPMEILGAIPLLGKAAKIAKANKYLAKTSRQAKSVNNFIKGTKAGAVGGRANDLSQFQEGYAPEEIFPDAGEDIIKYHPFGPKYNNGGSMSYYQHGLDWKPKSISRDGGWLDKYVPEAQTGFELATGIKPITSVTNSGESTSTGVQKRDAKLENDLRVEEQKQKQGQVSQTRPNTAAEEAERIRKNKAYASTHPYATVDEQGNLSAAQSDRTMEGKALPNTTAAGIDEGMGDMYTSMEIAGDLMGVGELASLGLKGIRPVVNEAISKIDQTVYPTRVYRAEAPGGNITGYTPSDLSKKVFDKGDFATKDLKESFEYLRGTEAMGGKPGLITGQDMNFTEYKVPFWKKDVSFDPDVVALKKLQGVDVNANEYIIPNNKILYPRKTTTIQAVPENIKNMETVLPSGVSTRFYNPGSIPMSPRSTEFASPAYKYIEDQMNAVTGQRMPITYDFDQTLGYNQNVPILNWEQPQFPSFKGFGNFKKGGIIKDDRGQWAHPGEITEIGSNQITMQGVPYPVLGVSDTGDTQMMYPEQDYRYNGNSVTEFPMMQTGGRTPIYTDDPRKVRAYNDSTIANQSTELLLRTLADWNKNPTDKNKKKYWEAQNNNIDWLRKFNATNNPVQGGKGEGWTSQNAPDGNPDFYFTYKKPVQPYILEQEPRLKGKVSQVNKLPMGEPSIGMGIRERQMPNIFAPNVEMSGPYMAGYTDYDTQQGMDRGFRSAEERDAFVEQLRQRQAGNYQPGQGNISSYYDVNKRKTKTVNQKETGGWLNQYK
jgi:hypothetical protein